jgi:2-hydroxy-6-oxonona-2,4-dienedioate hydrolase
MALTEEGILNVPGMASRWVRLASGCKAHYMTAGETGPAVVLMHGGLIGASGTASWRFMAPFLGANGFRVYCPDFPGFGLTERYDGAYTADLAGHLDFLHEFVTALCIDRFHASGNSMGCANTVNYVTAHPEKILSFALIAGSIGDLLPVEEVLAKLPQPKDLDRSILFKFDGTRESMVKMMGGIINDTDKVTDDLIDMRTLAARKHQDWYMKMNEHSIFSPQDPNVQARMRTKGRFDELNIPGIYMYGTEDQLMPPNIGGYPQEDVLERVQFFYPENTGHQGQTDSPDLFNQVFLEFFRDGKVAWETAQAAGISTRRPPLPDLVAVPETAGR